MGRYTKILRTKAMNKISKDTSIHQQVYIRSKNIFDQRKKEMLDDFNSHPVTKEIQAGPESRNISNTITGPGNLYSFIGFDRGGDPTRDVYNMLLIGTTISKRNPRITKSGKRVYMGFKINVPTHAQLSKITRMPWEPGSWLFKIERGLSGLGYYIYEKYIKSSRSGTGIQVDGKVRSGAYKPTSYMSAILNTFNRKFTK